MRRALLLAILVAPVVATAQTIGSGTIQFSDANNDLVHGPFISAAECQSGTVSLSWNTALATGATWPGSAKYTVYASNKESTAPNCNTANNGTDMFAGPVGVTITADGQAENLKPYPTNEFVTKSNLSCSTTADTPIFVCVQAYQSDGTTVVGYAKGKLTLSTSKPAAPSGVTAVPADDGALQISWTAPSGDPIAYDYVVNVTGTAAPDTTMHTRSDITATSVIVSGLTNDELYAIEVFARSQAGNRSDLPGTGSGTPRQVLNYWDLYHATYGGQEQGGCSTGAAGPVALLGVAALVAALRRRK